MSCKGENNHVPPATSWSRSAYIACRDGLLAMDADGLRIKRAIRGQRQIDLDTDHSPRPFVRRGRLLLLPAPRAHKGCRSLTKTTPHPSGDYPYIGNRSFASLRMTIERLSSFASLRICVVHSSSSLDSRHL